MFSGLSHCWKYQLYQRWCLFQSADWSRLGLPHDAVWKEGFSPEPSDSCARRWPLRAHICLCSQTPGRVWPFEFLDYRWTAETEFHGTHTFTTHLEFPSRRNLSFPGPKHKIPPFLKTCTSHTFRIKLLNLNSGCVWFSGATGDLCTCM